MNTLANQAAEIQLLEDRTLLAAYYVSPSGLDGASGDINNPFRTIQRAADLVQPGDVVTVRKGIYAGFVMSWDGPRGGTKDSPITFQAEKGVAIVARNPQTPDGINLEPGSHYVVIRGFRVINTTGSIERAGIRVVGSRGVVIRNNVVDQNGRWGIFTGFARGVVIRDNTASRSQEEHGIYVSNSADGPKILRNRVFSNRAAGIHMNGDLSQGGDGIISNALVSGNVIYENGRGGGSAINCDGVQNSKFENNLMYDNHASGISLYRIDGAQGSRNNVVVNNTIVQPSDGRWALNIKNGSTGNRVEQNILLNSHRTRGSINISKNSRTAFVSDRNVVVNRFSLTDGSTILTLRQWRSATAQDRNSVIVSASKLFVDPAGKDFHLADTSPVQNVGSRLLR